MGRREGSAPQDVSFLTGRQLLVLRANRQGNRGDRLHRKDEPLHYLEPKKPTSPARTHGLGGNLSGGRGYIRTTTFRPTTTNVMVAHRSNCRHAAEESVVARCKAHTDRPLMASSRRDTREREYVSGHVSVVIIETKWEKWCEMEKKCLFSHANVTQNEVPYGWEWRRNSEEA